MSYDLRIAVKVVGAEDKYAVIAEPEYSSPTYNLGKMFRKCMNWDFVQSEYYNVAAVYPCIVRGIQELTYNEGKYLKYNPENGWGDTKSALEALSSLKECIDHIVDDSYWTWNHLPKEVLYVAW